MAWVQFYNKIFSHPERPSDEIIEDDSRLDAWLHHQEAQARLASLPKHGSGRGKKEVFSSIA